MSFYEQYVNGFAHRVCEQRENVGITGERKKTRRSHGARRFCALSGSYMELSTAWKWQQPNDKNRKCGKVCLPHCIVRGDVFSPHKNIIIMNSRGCEKQTVWVSTTTWFCSVRNDNVWWNTEHLNLATIAAHTANFAQRPSSKLCKKVKENAGRRNLVINTYPIKWNSLRSTRKVSIIIIITLTTAQWLKQSANFFHLSFDFHHFRRTK